MENRPNVVQPDGRKIRRLRDQQGLTQDDLEHQTRLRDKRVSKRTIERIENGAPAQRTTIAALADALGVEPAELLGESALTETQPPEAIRRLIIPFDSYIADRSDGFVGRQFVFQAIDQFLADPIGKSGYFILQAKPGMGKSAFIAECIKTRGLAVYHFNVAALGICTPQAFLANICARMALRYNLPHVAPPVDYDSNGLFLANLLSEASKTLASRDRLLIAVDALDEVSRSFGPRSSNILFLPPVLPTGVFVIASTRDASEIPLRADNLKIFDLRHDSTLNMTDIETYTQRRLHDDDVRAWLKRSRIAQAKFIDTILAKSDGNFMYVRQVLSAIARGVYSSATCDELPSGLDNYYMDHWRRMGMQDTTASALKIRIIYLLCALLKPVSCCLLAEFADASPVVVQQVLDEWRSFLHVEVVDATPQYSLYHSSFRDFLLSKEVIRIAGVTFQAINDRIADKLERDLLDP